MLHRPQAEYQASRKISQSLGNGISHCSDNRQSAGKFEHLVTYRTAFLAVAV
jgi:hypothetical protein